MIHEIVTSLDILGYEENLNKCNKAGIKQFTFSDTFLLSLKQKKKLFSWKFFFFVCILYMLNGASTCT